MIDKPQTAELLEWFDKEFEPAMNKLGGLKSIRLHEIREILAAQVTKEDTTHLSRINDAKAMIYEILGEKPTPIKNAAVHGVLEGLIEEAIEEDKWSRKQ